jgi:hypothetical protein
MPSRKTTWVATSAGRSPSSAMTAPRWPGRCWSRCRPARTACPRRPPCGRGAAGPGSAPSRTRSRPPGAPRRPARRGCRASVRPAACPGARGRARAARRPAGGLGHQQVRRLGKLERERRVEQVGGRHAEVHVGGGLARRGVVGPRGQERDHVVAGDGLERGDRLRRWRRRRPHRADAACRDRPAAACASRTRVSISRHRLVLVRVTPDAAHLGSVYRSITWSILP